jgi:hypothetical protein
MTYAKTILDDAVTTLRTRFVEPGLVRVLVECAGIVAADLFAVLTGGR